MTLQDAVGRGARGNRTIQNAFFQGLSNRVWPELPQSALFSQFTPCIEDQLLQCYGRSIRRSARFPVGEEHPIKVLAASPCYLSGRRAKTQAKLNGSHSRALARANRF